MASGRGRKSERGTRERARWPSPRAPPRTFWTRYGRLNDQRGCRIGGWSCARSPASPRRQYTPTPRALLSDPGSLSFMAVTKTTPPAKASPAVSAQSPLLTLWKAYYETTSTRLKTIDAFLVFLMLSGIIQFLYCILVTNFPFNAFLAGYATSPPFISPPQLTTSSPASRAVLDSSCLPLHFGRRSTLPTGRNLRKCLQNGTHSKDAGFAQQLNQAAEHSQSSRWVQSCYTSSFTTSLDEQLPYSSDTEGSGGACFIVWPDIRVHGRCSIQSYNYPIIIQGMATGASSGATSIYESEADQGD